LGIVDLQTSGPLRRDAGRPPYAYAMANPVGRFDWLGLKSRACCKILRSTLSLARHCFLEIEDDTTGIRRTIGLHRTRKGVGKTFVKDRRDRVRNERNCGPWNDSCGTDDCVTQKANNYPRVS